MVKRRNRIGEPAEVAYKCVIEECDFVLRNRFFPEHYITHHEMPTGRFKCNACTYKCSYKARCIIKHIRRAHKGKARAVYNPFLNQEAHRVKTEHTDDCGDEKLAAKPKRIRKVLKKKTATTVRDNKRRVTRLSAARGSKDTTNEVVVADETKAEGKRKWKRNLNPDFEMPAKKKRADNSILNRDIPSTSNGVVQDVMEEDDDSVTSEETTEREVDEAVTSDDESDDEEVSNNVTSNQSFKVIPTENSDTCTVEQVEENKISSSLSSSDDESVDYNDTDSDDSDEEIEIDNNPNLENEENDVEILEINEVNSVEADRIRRRRGRDRLIQLMGHMVAHNDYSEAEFDDLMLELMSKFTENPEQSTSTLIEELTGRNPNIAFWYNLSCPSKLGDRAKINDVHECAVKSADKLQPNFIEYLVNSSERFRKDLAKMLWKTLMLRAAVYRADETIGHSEELKRRLLSLRCLTDAYKRANR